MFGKPHPGEVGKQRGAFQNLRKRKPVFRVNLFPLHPDSRGGRFEAGSVQTTKEASIMKKILVIAAALVMGSAVHAQKYGATPEDSITCLQNLSVYQEFFKQKNYSGAYDAWKKVLEVCPATSLNTYIRGNTILKNMIAKEKDATKRAQYIDEMLNLWDMRAKYYGRPGYCLGMKAYDMRQYAPNRLQEAMELYNQALTYAEEPQFVSIPRLYFMCMIDAYKAKLIDKEGLMDAYDKTEMVLEGITKRNPADQTASKELDIVGSMFEPYASCEDLVALYTQKFEANKGDAEYLRKATMMLNKRGCTDAEIFFQMTDALHVLDPNPQSAYLMASMYRSKKNFEKVVSLLTENDNISKLDSADKENALLMLGEAYLQLGQYVNGGRICQAILEHNPDNGKAYLILGLLYAGSVDQCSGDGTPVAKRAPYWVAVDMFVRAKSIDPSTADNANQLIANYSKYFPTADDLFTYGLREGADYTVSCWYTRTTKIRAAKL